MKKTIIKSQLFTLLFLLIASLSYGQAVSLPTDYIRNEIQGNNKQLANVQGSPYDSEVFVNGTVVSNKESFQSLLRYNAYSDGIEIQEGETVTELLKRKYISAQFNGKKYAIYQYISGNNSPKFGYLVELSSGSLKLLYRTKKELIKGKKATSSYKSDIPARFVETVTYYLQEDKSPAKEVKFNKKSIMPHFGKHQDALKAYISQNKLKIKKKDDLLKAINYYNTL